MPGHLGGDVERLDHIAERALVRELATWWQELNRSLFDGAMRQPTLVLAERVTLGTWRPARREIALSWSLVVDQPWGVVVEVLKHEMAHQYVHEVLGVTDETPHGEAFRRVCRGRGIDARAAGLPVADDDGGRVVRRIQKLLALGDSPNPHEAEAAVRAARRLMAEHATLLADRLPDPSFRTVQVGRPRQRIPKHERILAGLLGAHFHVAPIWVSAYDVVEGRRGQVLELVGRPEHVEVAQYMHDALLRLAEAAWRRHKRQQGIHRDRDRRRFLEGVLLGHADKLRSEAVDCAERGLVVQTEPALQAWFAARHPTVRRGRRLKARVDAAHRAGRRAGRRLSVAKGVGAGRAPRALPGASSDT